MSDVYAFGIVLYELLATTLPYTNIGNKDQVRYTQDYFIASPLSCHRHQLKFLILGCHVVPQISVKV